MIQKAFIWDLGPWWNSRWGFNYSCRGNTWFPYCLLLLGHLAAKISLSMLQTPTQYCSSQLSSQNVAANSLVASLCHVHGWSKKQNPPLHHWKASPYAITGLFPPTFVFTIILYLISKMIVHFFQWRTRGRAFIPLGIKNHEYCIYVNDHCHFDFSDPCGHPWAILVLEYSESFEIMLGPPENDWFSSEQMEMNFLESLTVVNSWKWTKFRGIITDMIFEYLSKILG